MQYLWKDWLFLIPWSSNQECFLQKWHLIASLVLHWGNSGFLSCLGYKTATAEKTHSLTGEAHRKVLSLFTSERQTMGDFLWKAGKMEVDSTSWRYETKTARNSKLLIYRPHTQTMSCLYALLSSIQAPFHLTVCNSMVTNPNSLYCQFIGQVPESICHHITLLMRSWRHQCYQ